MNGARRDELLIAVLAGDVERDDPVVRAATAADPDFAAALDELLSLAGRLDRLGEVARREAALPVEARDVAFVRRAIDGRRRRRLLLAVAAAGVVVVIGIAAFADRGEADPSVDRQGMTLGADRDLLPGPGQVFTGDFMSSALHPDTDQVTIRIFDAVGGGQLSEIRMPAARLPWRPDPAVHEAWPDQIVWVLEQEDAAGKPVTAPIRSSARMR